MKRRIRGWRACTGCLAGIVAFFMLVAACATDLLMVGNGTAAFCPEDADWIVTTPDFPRFFKNASATDLARALNDEAPRYYADWQLAVRRDTGIRPTPLRWRVWLGREFLAAVSSDGWGACVRPGFMLRAVDTLCGLRGWRPAVRRFGPYYYAWRDGALIFSRSEKYVLASLDAQPFNPPHARMTNDLWVFESRACRSAVRFFPKTNINITCWLEGGPITPRQTSPTLCDWPSGVTTAWATASRPADLRILAEAVSAIIVRHTEFSTRPWFVSLQQFAGQAAAPWAFQTLPADWDAHVVEFALVLFDIDVSEPIPVPEVGAVLRGKQEVLGQHPFEPLAAAGPLLPYEWDGQPGLIAPRQGEKAAMCLSSQGRDWLVASQEPVMARLLRALRQAPQPKNDCGEHAADAVTAIDWARAAKQAQSLARKWADLELFPRMNGEDVNEELIPLLRALERLGGARLYWAQEDARLVCRGALTGEAGP